MDDNTLTLEITCSLWTEIDDHQTHVDIKTIKGMDLMYFTPLLVLPTKARIFVFRFNIEEYCGLMDFGPKVIIGLIFYMRIFERWYFGLVLKLEISYNRVMIS
jgi:hypothetical protein